MYLEINPPGNILYIFIRYIFGDKSCWKYTVYCLDIYLEINPPGNILYILFRYIFGDKSSWKYIWMAVVLGSNIIAGKAPCSII